ncbi:MltR family transcriptional regulator (plasmid) [Mesorhizobium sp. AaZ16]|uniref:MltR family transcriptional regulator n=1 Tax=Mesorhizobium sp. AaZ16 TaxID=3402289 RepID=UPI00374F6C46
MAKGLRVPTEQLSEETQQLYDVLNNEKDLAVILIAASFLDVCLRSLLEKKLLEGSVSDRMLSHKGVLGSMSARADLCYALGLLPKRAYQDLGAIAEIRNIVAHHHLTQSFKTGDIAAKCATLDAISLGGTKPDQMPPRMRFTLAVTLLANSLLVTALHLQRQPQVKSPRDPSRIRFRGG